MTEAELAAQSNLHSGAWQRRAGARLAGKFLPRRQFIGYGRGRGEIVPEDSSSFEDDPPALPGPKIYVEDDDGVYLEQDPNLMEPSARAAWNENRRRRVLDEAAALAATRGLDGTVARAQRPEDGARGERKTTSCFVAGNSPTALRPSDRS